MLACAPIPQLAGFRSSFSKLLKGEQVPVHAKQIEKQWMAGSRFYLHARNQADALRFIILQSTARPLRYSQGLAKPERFNVRGEVEIQNDDMVALIAELMGLDGTKSHVKYVNVEGTRPGHDLRYALTGDKLLNMGWTPPVPLRESLDRTIKWTRANPQWLV